MINGYAQVGLFQESLEVFSEIQAYGFQPIHGCILQALNCAFVGALEQRDSGCMHILKELGFN